MASRERRRHECQSTAAVPVVGRRPRPAAGSSSRRRGGPVGDIDHIDNWLDECVDDAARRGHLVDLEHDFDPGNLHHVIDGDQHYVDHRSHDDLEHVDDLDHGGRREASFVHHDRRHHHHRIRKR